LQHLETPGILENPIHALRSYELEFWITVPIYVQFNGVRKCSFYGTAHGMLV
jgi:hypothetical protein